MIYRHKIFVCLSILAGLLLGLAVVVMIISAQGVFQEVARAERIRTTITQMRDQHAALETYQSSNILVKIEDQQTTTNLQNPAFLAEEKAIQQQKIREFAALHPEMLPALPESVTKSPASD